MIIHYKNQGEYIPYEEIGKKVCFDDDLTINLAKRQEDQDVHIDICFDKYGEMVIGAAAGRRYVAEIDIPKKEYIYPEPEEGEEPEPPTPVPLDMDTVTLTLWAID